MRSDWTLLARQFQREIYRRVFPDEPLEDYVKQTADAVLTGQRDADLVYRKRLRRKLEDYVKNVPPHAQVPRKSKRTRRFVCYVDRQIAPAADARLQVKGTSVSKILDRQMSSF